MRYNRRRLGIRLRPNSRGDMKVVIDQYASQLVEIMQPSDRDRHQAFLVAREFVIGAVQAAIYSSSVNGTSEALEQLDEIQSAQRLAQEEYFEL
jgi:hypothetical protein